MDADRALKKLFKLRATDLLPVTGDRRAQVVSRLVPEINAVTRRRWPPSTGCRWLPRSSS